MRSDPPILLVEDDAVDAMAIKRALKEINASGELKIVGNGCQFYFTLPRENAGVAC